MRLIHPSASRPLDLSSSEALDDLAGAYAYPSLGAGEAWLRANMVTSLDGATQGADGRSASVSSPPDRRVLSLLRGLADVVLVGAGTARAEGYGPVEPRPEYAAARRRAGQLPAPPIAVVSRSLDLDPAARLFAADGAQRTIVVTVDSSPADRRRALAGLADVVVAGDTSIDVDAAVAALAERGLQRIDCEGGAHLLGHIIAAGRLDELCYTITPAIVGGSSNRLIETALQLTSEWELAHIIEDGGTLLTRWLARRP